VAVEHTLDVADIVRIELDNSRLELLRQHFAKEGR